MKYWLCCGGKEPNHHLYYYCTEGNAGHPERVRYGTAEEHKEWSKKFYSEGKEITEEVDYDVVLDTLCKARNHLMKMNQSNANIGMFSMMDQIRYEQISHYDKAIKLWEENK